MDLKLFIILSGAITRVATSPEIFATKKSVLIERLSCTGYDISINDSQTNGTTANKPNPFINKNI